MLAQNNTFVPHWLIKDYNFIKMLKKFLRIIYLMEQGQLSQYND
jgi:hypothetical protein